jgi:hypothetical protein
LQLAFIANINNYEIPSSGSLFRLFRIAAYGSKEAACDPGNVSKAAYDINILHG